MTARDVIAESLRLRSGDHPGRNFSVLAEQFCKDLSSRGFAIVPKSSVCEHPNKYVRVVTEPRHPMSFTSPVDGEFYCPDCQTVWLATSAEG